MNTTPIIRENLPIRPGNGYLLSPGRIFWAARSSPAMLRTTNTRPAPIRLPGYDLHNPELPAPLHLSAEVAYNDGLGGRVSDWSYATFGVSTKLDINENTAFVPGVYHQVSMDDSICKRDVTYAMLSMKYKFK